jgi:hypothetical protein
MGFPICRQNQIWKEILVGYWNHRDLPRRVGKKGRIYHQSMAFFWEASHEGLGQHRFVQITVGWWEVRILWIGSMGTINSITVTTWAKQEIRGWQSGGHGTPFFNWQTPVGKGGNRKSPINVGVNGKSINGEFSIAMFDYWRVSTKMTGRWCRNRTRQTIGRSSEPERISQRSNAWYHGTISGSSSFVASNKLYNI